MEKDFSLYTIPLGTCERDIIVAFLITVFSVAPPFYPGSFPFVEVNN